VQINSAWETIRENITISAKESLGYFELKKHKPWFHKGCSRLLYQGKEAKLQWLHDPSEINGDNLNNVRHEPSRYFRNKKREYLKDTINKQGYAIPHLLFNFALEYAIRKIQEKQVGLKLYGTHQLLAYTDDVNVSTGR
jgi:hypothetical protein